MCTVLRYRRTSMFEYYSDGDLTTCSSLAYIEYERRLKPKRRLEKID